MERLQVRIPALCAASAALVVALALSAPSNAALPAATITLQRDLPRAVARSTDEGKLPDGVALPHVNLVLTRPPALQAALDKLTHDQRVRGSADYHRWLQPAQLRRYGPAQADIGRVVGWLTSQGLRVNRVSPSGMAIDFGGSAGRVAAAFHTQLHYVLHSGEAHISNVTAPAIPAALAPVVTGVTLSNFFPKPALIRARPSFTKNTTYGTFYAVAPSDFATIYNVKPLRGNANFYGSPITGTGVTVALVEDTMMQQKDWNRFRSIFGLSGYSASFTQVQPGGCTSPGINGDEIEAAIDAEWASAVAPSANIIEASCAGTSPFEFGVITAVQNMVESGTPATILSISYEYDEIAAGYALEALWNNLMQEGASQGKAIFVAAGDNGVSADRNNIDSDGLFVNGLADTAYNVSVGGTDFHDTALGENAEYWHAKNGRYGGSAASYVPEIPWDNSCASSVLWKFLGATGPIPFCNTATGQGEQNGVGGSGSQSDYYTKPDWQATGVLGVPNDGVRDQPDVSLFAANGLWGHFYLECMSDASEGGVPCNYGNQNDFFGSAYGGTSFGSPAFAGIAALVQETNEPPGVGLGNPAPIFYAVAQAQFTTPLGLSQCDSSLGNKISSACVFQYVTAGDNTEPCYAGTAYCDAGPKGIGVLAKTVDGTGAFAYQTHPGYSLATGLGTVNVTNLLYNYNTGL